MIDLYEVLGVDKDATADEIKEAYRNKAKEHHPDVKGGDNERMTEITIAWGVLKSESGRNRYDKTGQMEDTPFDVKFQELVQFAFLKIVEEVEDVASVNLLKQFNHYIKISVADNLKNKKIFEGRSAKLVRVKERLSAKGDNKIVRVLDINLHDIKMMLGNIDEQVKFLNDALEVINHYDYRIDPPVPEPEVSEQERWKNDHQRHFMDNGASWFTTTQG